MVCFVKIWSISISEIFKLNKIHLKLKCLSPQDLYPYVWGSQPFNNHSYGWLKCHSVQSSLINVERPTWISKLEPFNGTWYLSENGKPRGQFDAIVIAHNGNICIAFVISFNSDTMSLLSLHILWSSLIYLSIFHIHNVPCLCACAWLFTLFLLFVYQQVNVQTACLVHQAYH